MFLFIFTLFLNYFIYLTFADKFLVNEFYDKTIPEAEIPLSFSSIRNRREVFEVNFKVGEESGPSNRNAIYNRGYFEGDIATNGISSNTIKEFLGEINAPRGVSRNAVRNPAVKWPKNGQNVLIPVAYSSQYTHTSIYKIERAMREFHNRTCIRFIPKTSSHIDYVYVAPETFCHSEVGRKGGKQILSLTGECIRGSEGVGAIIHELMHTIGFYHEQSRADRNNYVTIHLENVLDDAKATPRPYTQRAQNQQGVRRFNSVQTQQQRTTPRPYTQRAQNQQGVPGFNSFQTQLGVPGFNSFQNQQQRMYPNSYANANDGNSGSGNVRYGDASFGNNGFTNSGGSSYSWGNCDPVTRKQAEQNAIRNAGGSYSYTC